MDEIKRDRLNLLIAEHVMGELYWQAGHSDSGSTILIGVPRLEKEIAIKNCEENSKNKDLLAHFGPLTPTKVVVHDYVSDLPLAMSVLERLRERGFEWTLRAVDDHYDVSLDHKNWSWERATTLAKGDLSAIICDHVVATLELDGRGWPPDRKCRRYEGEFAR